MEYLWNSETLRKITRGQTNKNWDISGVSIDTRNLKKGDMFCLDEKWRKNSRLPNDFEACLGVFCLALMCLACWNARNNKQQGSKRKARRPIAG